jgi:hypothetical protein
MWNHQSFSRSPQNVLSWLLNNGRTYFLCLLGNKARQHCNEQPRRRCLKWRRSACSLFHGGRRCVFLRRNFVYALVSHRMCTCRWHVCLWILQIRLLETLIHVGYVFSVESGTNVSCIDGQWVLFIAVFHIRYYVFEWMKFVCCKYVLTKSCSLTHLKYIALIVYISLNVITLFKVKKGSRRCAYFLPYQIYNIFYNLWEWIYDKMYSSFHCFSLLLYT